MAVAYDSTAPGTTGSSTTTAASLTWSHTPSASGAAIVVGVALGASTSTQNAFTLSVTCGGVAMTSLGKVQSNNGTVGYVQVFGILGQTNTAKTITVTASGTPTSLVGGSIAYSGANAFGTAVTAAGSSTTPSVTVPATGTSNVMFTGVCGGAAISAAGTGVTSRWIGNASGASGAGEGAGGFAASAASGSVTMTWTMATDFWGIVGVEILAVAPSPPRPIRVARQAVARSYNY